MLLGTKRQADSAREQLIQLVAPPPKRPLYYCQHELQFLPRWTRDALRDLGDYIDLLLKEALYEITSNERVFRNPFGSTIDAIAKLPRRTFSDDLLSKLRIFNNFIYAPAKHDFKLPTGRRDHRFTSREVVISAFVTMRLAATITELSQRARLASLDKLPMNDYHYEWQT